MFQWLTYFLSFTLTILWIFVPRESSSSDEECFLFRVEPFDVKPTVLTTLLLDFGSRHIKNSKLTFRRGLLLLQLLLLLRGLLLLQLQYMTHPTHKIHHEQSHKQTLQDLKETFQWTGPQKAISFSFTCTCWVTPQVNSLHKFLNPVRLKYSNYKLNY